MPPVGALPRNRRGQRHIEVRGGVAVNLHGGKMFGFGRIGEPVDVGLPTHSSKCHHAVVKRRAAAEHQVPAVGVGAGQMPSRSAYRCKLFAPIRHRHG